MGSNVFIFLSNGFYFGFIQDGLLFSRDGIYSGWVEDNLIVWDSLGRFRGSVTTIKEKKYVLRDRLSMPPISRVPKAVVSSVAPPAPPANIPPIDLPVNLIDAF